MSRLSDPLLRMLATYATDQDPIGLGISSRHLLHMAFGADLDPTTRPHDYDDLLRCEALHRKLAWAWPEGAARIRPVLREWEGLVDKKTDARLAKKATS